MLRRIEFAVRSLLSFLSRLVSIEQAEPSHRSQDSTGPLVDLFLAYLAVREGLPQRVAEQPALVHIRQRCGEGNRRGIDRVGQGLGGRQLLEGDARHLQIEARTCGTNGALGAPPVREDEA